VLSLETGHERDYSEGAAYRDYFSNDTLYFQVPHDDQRLRNKAARVSAQRAFWFGWRAQVPDTPLLK